MKIVWCTRSFLVYRIPVFAELGQLLKGQLTLLSSGDYVPERVQKKIQAVLGERAIGLTGEWKLGREDQNFMANRNVSLRYQPGIGKRIRELQPDCLIGDGFFKWTFPCLLEQCRRKTPLVVCYERTAHTERNIQWFRRLYRGGGLKHIDATCGNGRLSAEYVESLGFPAERITRGHMAADTTGLATACAQVTEEQKDALREKFQLPATVLLFVGRLHSRKGLSCLLEAWAALPAGQRQDAALLLAGDGPQRTALEEQCRQLGIADSVRFAGAVDYDRIAQYYAVASAFIIPTLEDNWSLVVPEAMACSLQILCSVYNGCWPEMVHPENGWTFDPLKIRDFTGILAQGLMQRNRLPEMGACSQKLVAAHSPANAAKGILDACKIAIRKA